MLSFFTVKRDDVYIPSAILINLAPRPIYREGKHFLPPPHCQPGNKVIFDHLVYL